MRSRNIKPGFFKNELLADLPFATRLLFAGLWLVADREGRMEDRPKRIKGELFPYDNLNVDRALQDLHNAGFIIRYELGGNKYISLPTWDKHQNPHVREPKSTIPAPGQHSAEPVPSTEPAPDEHGTGPADSLIPDSLIPDMGNPDSGGTPPLSAPPAQPPTPPCPVVLPVEQTSKLGAIEDFFEDRYSKHPKKGHRTHAMSLMARIPDIDHFDVQDQFAEAHDAWIACDDWKWKSGAKAPFFDEFIQDQGYRYRPDSAESKQKSQYKPFVMPKGAVI